MAVVLARRTIGTIAPIYPHTTVEVDIELSRSELASPYGGEILVSIEAETVIPPLSWLERLGYQGRKLLGPVGPLDLCFSCMSRSYP